MSAWGIYIRNASHLLLIEPSPKFWYYSGRYLKYDYDWWCVRPNMRFKDGEVEPHWFGHCICSFPKQFIPSELVEKLVAACQSSSYSRVEDEVGLILLEGYSAFQLIMQIHNWVVQSPLSDAQKAATCYKIAVSRQYAMKLFLNPYNCQRLLLAPCVRFVMLASEMELTNSCNSWTCAVA